MHILYKFAALVLPAALVLTLGACAKDARFDYSELNLRLEKSAPQFVFDETALFYADRVYYYSYSFAEADDTLLTLKEDEAGRLERISVTTGAAPGADGYTSFCDLALALTGLFIPEADAPYILEQVGLTPAPAADAAPLTQYKQGFYEAALFSADGSRTFLLLYG